MINYRLVSQAILEVSIMAAKILAVIMLFLGVIFALAWTMVHGHYWVTPLFLITSAMGLFVWGRYQDLYAQDLKEKQRVIDALRQSETIENHKSAINSKHYWSKLTNDYK